MVVEKMMIEANDTNYLLTAVMIFIAVYMVFHIIDWVYLGKRKKRLEKIARLIRERHNKIEVENEYRFHLKNELELNKRLAEQNQNGISQ